jgi:hypothetical protein
MRFLLKPVWHTILVQACVAYNSRSSLCGIRLSFKLVLHSILVPSLCVIGIIVVRAYFFRFTPVWYTYDSRLFKPVWHTTLFQICVLYVRF